MAAMTPTETAVPIAGSNAAAADSQPAFLTDHERWAAVVASDAIADGSFYYSVATTGVYCRPSCAARLARRENVAFHATCADAERAGFRPCKRCRPDAWAMTVAVRSKPTGTAACGTEPSLAARVAALDWQAIAERLDSEAYALLPAFFTRNECRELAALYDLDQGFRSRVVMARHNFGRGEYKYFAYPLPDLVADLRTALYPPLATIANRWNEAMGLDIRYPATHEAYLARCHDAGQTRPTPLMLQYGPGDYNCLHQDLYGEHVFPLQTAFLLAAPDDDFTGGEFVLTEQRPRMQSRAQVVPLRQGDGVIFPVRHRPVHGKRGVYRVNMRHGVSQVRSGHRQTLGVIFHDAE